MPQPSLCDCLEHSVGKQSKHASAVGTRIMWRLRTRTCCQTARRCPPCYPWCSPLRVVCGGLVVLCRWFVVWAFRAPVASRRAAPRAVCPHHVEPRRRPGGELPFFVRAVRRFGGVRRAVCGRDERASSSSSETPRGSTGFGLSRHAHLGTDSPGVSARSSHTAAWERQGSRSPR